MKLLDFHCDDCGVDAGVFCRTMDDIPKTRCCLARHLARLAAHAAEERPRRPLRPRAPAPIVARCFCCKAELRAAGRRRGAALPTCRGPDCVREAWREAWRRRQARRRPVGSEATP